MQIWQFEMGIYNSMANFGFKSCIGILLYNKKSVTFFKIVHSILINHSLEFLKWAQMTRLVIGRTVKYLREYQPVHLRKIGFEKKPVCKNDSKLTVINNHT